MIKHIQNIKHSFWGKIRIYFLRSKYNEIGEQLFNRFIFADPTANKEYLRWIVGGYLKCEDKNSYVENLKTVNKYLQAFHSYKIRNIISEKDINKYKNFKKLLIKLKECGGVGETEEDENYLLEDRYFINTNAADVFCEDSSYLIVVVRTYESSEFYGINTQWCTKHLKQYLKYSVFGNIYVIIDKSKLNTDCKYRMMQCQFESAQFRDVNNNDVPAKIKRNIIHYFKDVPFSYHLKYDRVWPFKEGIAKVKLGRYFGYINETGDEISKIIYSKARDYHNGSAKICKGRLWGCLDKNGNEKWD